MSLLREIIAESSSEDERDLLVSERPRKRKVYLFRPDRFTTWDDASFLARFRVSKNMARWLVQQLHRWLKPPTLKNKAVTPEQQILIALEYYACGSFQRCVGDTAGVHKSTVSRIINRVSRAIASMRTDWISMPRSAAEMESTARDFYSISAFPKVIGAIDCTHIPIKSPGSCLSYGHSCWGAHGKRSGRPPIAAPDWYLTRLMRRIASNSDINHARQLPVKSDDLSAIFQVEMPEDSAAPATDRLLSENQDISMEVAPRAMEAKPMLDDELLSKIKLWQIMREAPEDN